jgi:hypothetical protein
MMAIICTQKFAVPYFFFFSFFLSFNKDLFYYTSIKKGEVSGRERKRDKHFPFPTWEMRAKTLAHPIL